MLPVYREKILPLVEIILSNLIIIGEVPAPTFKEQARTEVLLSRFSDYQLLNSSTDELGNALTMIPGTKGDRTILLTAHIDNAETDVDDYTVSIQPDYAMGPGVGDNAIGLATLVSFPLIIDQLGLEFESNIILMCSSRSMGRGNLEGLKFFLANTNVPISAGVCVEGVELGMLSYYSLGLFRADLTYRVPEEYDWTRFGAGGAIINLNEAINRIQEIPLPHRPRTSVVFGAIDGGSGYDSVATQATLRFEVRSESADTVTDLGRTISNIAQEVAAKAGSEVKLDIIANHGPGGIAFSHPLAVNSRTIMEKLGIEPRIMPNTSELSAFIERNIPAVGIALTHGEHLNEPNELIHIAHLPTGIAQLVGILQAVDKGCPHV